MKNSIKVGLEKPNFQAVLFFGFVFIFHLGGCLDLDRAEFPDGGDEEDSDALERSNTDTDSDTATDSGTKSVPNLDTGIDSDIDTGADSNSDSGTDSDTDTNINSEKATDADTDTDTDLDAGTDTDSETATDSVDTDTDTQTVLVCKDSELKCEDKCVPNDIKNCGVCGHDCTALPHVVGEVKCTLGVCTLTKSSCDNGWEHCAEDPDKGCETNITEAGNCGECGNDCTKTNKKLCTPADDGYVCAADCPPNAPTQCGDSCVNTSDNPLHCGKCNNKCESATGGRPVCKSGECGFECNDPTYLKCSDGCFPNDDEHCGDCENDCTKNNKVCNSQGTCVECMEAGDCKGNSAKLCINNICKECTSGACCDTATNLYFPKSHICKKTTEYRCNGTGCGADAQEHVVNRYCSGTSSVCNGSEVGAWATIDACEMNEVCETNGTTSASCVTCERGCSAASGKCYPEVVKSCTDGWCTIPAGCFWMGSPDGTCPEGYTGSCESEPGRIDDETLHYVELTGSFELMQTEVTQEDFAALMKGWNPSRFGPNGSWGECGLTCPVENVSWYDTLVYANALSAKQGLTPCYTMTNILCEDGIAAEYNVAWCMNTTQGGIDSATVGLNGVTSVYDCTGYRLPTEAEWEYAVRAGTDTAFYNGGITYTDETPLDPNLDAIGWYVGNPSAAYSTYDCSGWYPGATTCGPQGVGGKAANAWGFYDMNGNVQEWVWDWGQEYDSAGTVASPLVDPAGPSSASDHVVRGGGWGNLAGGCRSASRRDSTPGFRSDDFGFRLARSK